MATQQQDRGRVVRQDRAAVRPLRVTPAIAAQMLSVSKDYVYDLITKGVFTVIAPNGRGIGKRLFLHTDEVEKYAENSDELAVRALRIEKKRLKTGR